MSAMSGDGFKAQQQEFVLNSLLHRKPMKKAKQRSDVSRPGGPENKSGSIVLDLSKF